MATIVRSGNGMVSKADVGAGTGATAVGGGATFPTGGMKASAGAGDSFFLRPVGTVRGSL